MEEDVDSDKVSSSLDDGATSSSGGTTTTYGPALNYKPNNKFTASVKLLEANLGDTSKFAEVVDKSSSFYVEHGCDSSKVSVDGVGKYEQTPVPLVVQFTCCKLLTCWNLKLVNYVNEQEL